MVVISDSAGLSVKLLGTFDREGECRARRGERECGGGGGGGEWRERRR